MENKKNDGGGRRRQARSPYNFNINRSRIIRTNLARRIRNRQQHEQVLIDISSIMENILDRFDRFAQQTSIIFNNISRWDTLEQDSQIISPPQEINQLNHDENIHLNQNENVIINQDDNILVNQNENVIINQDENIMLNQQNHKTSASNLQNETNFSSQTWENRFDRFQQ
ncbi:unnamed protein product, partial [Brachionus calyciflorus]